MSARLLWFCWLGLLLLACQRKQPADVQKVSETPAAIEPAASPEPDMSAVLQELTQLVRRCAAERQIVPKSLNEVVAAGYLDHVPAAPAGKGFAIDKKLQVILVKQ